MEELLKEILSRDKSILARRDDLIKILDEKIPNNQRRTYAAFKKALTLNVGEIFLLNDLTSAEKQDRAWQILKESGMQDTKIDDVINIFVKILNLDVLPQKLKIEDRITAIEENLKFCFIDEKLLLRVKNLENKIADLEKIITSLNLENSALEMRFERLANDFNKTPSRISTAPKEIKPARFEKFSAQIETPPPEIPEIIKSFIKDYNILINETAEFEKKIAREKFVAKYKVRCFNCVNYYERKNQPKLPPIFEGNYFEPGSEYWAYKVESNSFAVVPNIRNYNYDYHIARAMCEVFYSNFKGGNYSNIQVERAAEFTNSGKNWTLIRKGKLILR